MTVSAATAAPVPLSADISNPGNQMLRKMGWTEGQGLGRDGTGMEQAVGVILAEGKDGTGSGSGAGSGIASGAGAKRVVGVGAEAQHGYIPPLDYHGEGRAYKDSLLRAAKARYDMVSKQGPPQ
jgi:hypothetical protein